MRKVTTKNGSQDWPGEKKKSQQTNKQNNRKNIGGLKFYIEYP